MDAKPETAGSPSDGRWLRWRAHQTLPVGTACANCATAIQGPYCHYCGQFAESYQRSVLGLFVEGFESFFHFDGRFWRTLPELLWRPGKLTRDYLDGKRASQIPPFRLFLVVLLIVLFAGGDRWGELDRLSSAGTAGAHGPTATSAAAILPGPRGAVPRDDAGETAFARWVNSRARAVGENPELYKATVEHWAHQFAILLLPISALLLSLLFAFQRRVYVFDHLIFAMHSLAFQGLLLSVVFLLGRLTPLAGWLLVLSPAHLFVHMRGTYGASVIGTLSRMGLLFAGMLIAGSLLMAGLYGFGLILMKGG